MYMKSENNAHVKISIFYKSQSYPLKIPTRTPVWEPQGSRDSCPVEAVGRPRSCLFVICLADRSSFAWRARNCACDVHELLWDVETACSLDIFGKSSYFKCLFIFFLSPWASQYEESNFITAWLPFYFPARFQEFASDRHSVASVTTSKGVIMQFRVRWLKAEHRSGSTEVGK